MRNMTLGVVALLASAATVAATELPDAIAARGEALALTLHAQGVQIYECKADKAGALTWSFREPVASLIEAGKTVGRHYAGPHWELDDGSIVAAKVSGRAAGQTLQDIPLLKLDVTNRKGSGRLNGVTTVQRINTKGGTLEGSCSSAGALLSIPYTADYTFLRAKEAAAP